MSTFKYQLRKILSPIPILDQLFTDPPTPYGDGLTDQEAAPNPSSTGLSVNSPAELIALFPEFDELIKLLTEIASQKNELDDRKLQIEELIQTLAALPSTGEVGKLREYLTNGFIEILWKGMPHPPATYVGENFRSANGVGRSLVFLDIGKEMSAYARTVRPSYPAPLALPEPSDIFDSMLVRKSFKPHPNGISANLFYLATLIIHDLFDTKHSEGDYYSSDAVINKTTSYLDLSPLYGHNQEMQNKVRTMSFGKLKQDTFADSRLLLMGPGVCALLVMFSRNHNRIADMLLKINENNRFPYKPNMSEKELVALDQKLFQTSRYINCCFYLNVIMHDYLSSILGLNHTNTTWFIDPTPPIPGVFGGDPVPFGTGNANSVEFNFIYRWHAAISEQDEKWVDNEFTQIFGKDPTVEEFGRKFAEWTNSLDEDPAKWTFDGLKRGSDGRYEDKALGQIFVNGTDWVAGAFGPHNIPKTIRIIEILGMTQARRWGVCTLNEFRQFIGCKVYETFEDINPDKEIANTLFKLYKHVDNVELYPGLLAEDTKPPMIGSGICLNYSTSRAILFDAITLVRGDRLFTHGNNPRDLTTWGYNECRGDPSVAQGAVLYKILFTNLPGFYKYNSAYALYPFTTPETTKAFLTKKGVADQYDFSTPKPSMSPTALDKYTEVVSALKNNHVFQVTYAPKMEDISHKYGFFLAWDDENRHDADRTVFQQAVYDSPRFKENLKEFYRSTIRKVIERASYTLPGQSNYSRLDIVHNVCNVVPVHFAAEYFCISVKSEDNPHGIFTEQELYSQLATIFAFLFLDLDEVQSAQLRSASLEFSENIEKVMTFFVKSSPIASVVNHISDAVHTDLRLPQPGSSIATTLFKQGWTTQRIVANMFGCAVGAVAAQGQAISQTVDFYLRPENAKYLKDLQKLAQSNTAEADEAILGYILEASRLNPWAPGILRVAAETMEVHPQGQKKTLHKGDPVFVSLAGAMQDPQVFPNPKEVDCRRPKDKYITFGSGFHRCFGEPINKLVLPVMFKEILKLKNLRRAPGPQGQLKNLALGGVPTFVTQYSKLWPFPPSMVVLYDGTIDS